MVDDDDLVAMVEAFHNDYWTPELSDMYPVWNTEKALLAALRAAEARGLKLVRREADTSMLIAGLQAALDYYGMFGFKRLWPWSRGGHPSRCLAACHRAMHDAAPGVGGE